MSKHIFASITYQTPDQLHSGRYVDSHVQCTIFNAYFTTSGYSIATADFILGNNPVYATDQADRIQFLNNVIDILYSVNFPEEYVQPQ